MTAGWLLVSASPRGFLVHPLSPPAQPKLVGSLLTRARMSLAHALYESDWEAAATLITPVAAREKGKDGDLPLHLALWKQAPAEAVAQLVAAYPEAAREKDKYGNQPLHLALKRNGAKHMAPAEVVAQLVAAYPEATREKDKDGSLPLHWAVRNQAPAEVVAQLVAAYAEAAREKDKDGDLPLHLALKYKAPAEVVAQLVAAYPDAAREKNNNGDLPLHVAAYAEDYNQWRHWAVRYQAPAEVVAQLVAAYAEAAREKDKDGSLPLHLALWKQAPAEVVAQLVAAYPEATREKDKDGSLPLHWAVRNQAPAEVVAQLVAAYAEAAREKDKDGDLPLHLALKYKASAAVVVQLLVAYPQAAVEQRIKDSFKQASTEAIAWGNLSSINAVAGTGTTLSLDKVSVPTDDSLSRLLSLTPQLTELSLRNCGLVMLPPQLGQLTALRTLDLSNNALTDGPLALAGLTGLAKLQTLRLGGTPSLSQLATISDVQGAPAVLTFLKDAHDDAHHNFSLKLVLAGPSEAGKSSLLRALHGGEYQLMRPDERTIGLDIERLVLLDPRGRAPAPGVSFLAYDAGGHDEVGMSVFPFIGARQLDLCYRFFPRFLLYRRRRAFFSIPCVCRLPRSPPPLPPSRAAPPLDSRHLAWGVSCRRQGRRGCCG